MHLVEPVYLKCCHWLHAESCSECSLPCLLATGVEQGSEKSPPNPHTSGFGDGRSRAWKLDGNLASFIVVLNSCAFCTLGQGDGRDFNLCCSWRLGELGGGSLCIMEPCLPRLTMTAGERQKIWETDSVTHYGRSWKWGYGGGARWGFKLECGSHLLSWLCRE